jgi:hypothetical protein
MISLKTKNEWWIDGINRRNLRWWTRGNEAEAWDERKCNWFDPRIFLGDIWTATEAHSSLRRYLPNMIKLGGTVCRLTIWATRHVGRRHHRDILKRKEILQPWENTPTTNRPRHKLHLDGDGTRAVQIWAKLYTLCEAGKLSGNYTDGFK